MPGWSRPIPVNPGPGDLLDNKKEVEDRLLPLQTELVEMNWKLAQQRKYRHGAERDFKPTALQPRPGGAEELQLIARRQCGLRGRLVRYT